MKDFFTQYSATRFALDRHDRRRRGQPGVLWGLVQLSWLVVRIVLLLPTALFRLLVVSVRTTHGADDPATDIVRDRGGVR